MSNIRFPIKGLHRGFVTEVQPELTSPDLNNVRPYDSLDQRARGGQRPGLDKAYAQQIGGAAASIVDMTTVTIVDAVLDIPSVKESHVTPNDSELNVGATSFVTCSQVFTTTSVYSMTGVQLRMRLDGSPTSIRVELRTVTAGTPDGNATMGAGLADTGVLAATVVSVSESWVTFTFVTPYTVANGTQYAIVAQVLGGSPSDHVAWREDNSSSYAGGNGWYFPSPAWVSSTDDFLFKAIGKGTSLVEETYTKKLVAVCNNEFWYESSPGVMTELADANADIDTGAPLQMFEAYEKVLVVNGSNLKVADFGNAKIATADVGANPPDFGTVLTGGTSGAQMIVDYITALSSACVIYGSSITLATFDASETVTGTDDDGNAVSFTMTAVDEIAGPHWYDWTVYGNSTTYGIMPTKATLGVNYRGRAVLSGNIQYPFQWYMSRQGNIWDWQYLANDQQSPVAGGNSDAGEVGSPVTTMIPYKDDYLIYGAASALYYLIGDPMAGGSINELSLTEGVLGVRAWCWDATENLYILSTSGLQVIAPGFRGMENLTSQSFPKFMATLDYDPATDRVTMSYDRDRFGINICNTVVSTGVNRNYWYGLRTGGIFPETYPTQCGVFSAYQYDATDPTYQKRLYGSADGYIRLFDDNAKDDDIGGSDTAIDSYVTFGPIHLDDKEDGEGLIGPIVPVLAGGSSGGGQSDSNDVAFKIFVGRDSETVVESLIANGTARISGTYTAPGRRRGGQDIRSVRGAWAGIRIGNATAAQWWAMESLKVSITPVGRVL